MSFARLASCVPIVLLGLAAVTAGCGSRAPVVTGLVVTIELGSVTADQLEIGVSTADAQVVMPTPRPASPAAALRDPQSVSIFLPDALAGTQVTCSATPLSGGQRSGATVSGTASLVLHVLVPLTLELVASPHDDAGAPDAADDGGGAGGSTDGGSPEAGLDGPLGTKALGQPCGSASECDSTLCVDGVCCGSTCTNLCQACNLPGREGTCAPVSLGDAPVGAGRGTCANQGVASCGYDGTCDGNGACHRYPAGAACKAASCQGATFMPSSACDGQGTCVAAKGVDCTPYNCATGAGGPACAATCTTGGTQCASPAVCATGSCGMRLKKANGAGCTGDADCDSAHCADGVCCLTACTGACVSCNLPGTEGTCHSVAAGKADPHVVCKDAGAASCGRNGLCDGAGACALYATTTTCAAGSCKTSTLHPARHCDGKGACAVAADVDCMTYRCDPTTTACFTSCTVGALQCTSRRNCSGGACQ